MTQLRHDLRDCFRAFRAAPVFVCVTVLSVGLAMGAVLTAFGFADTLFFRPLPIPDAAALVTFEQRAPRSGRQYPNLSLLDRDRLATALSDTVFTGVAAVTWADGFTPDTMGAPTHVSLVTGNYFAVMDVPPARGRGLAPADDEGDGQAVVVISDAYWQRRYRRDPGALGRTLVLNGVATTIVGIAPRAFTGDWVGWPTDVWMPTSMASRIMGLPGGSEPRSRLQYKVLARLRSRVTLAAAQAAASAVYRDLQANPPSASGIVADAQLTLTSAARGYSAQRAALAQPLTIAAVIALVVLLVACINTANLLLARAAAREREIAVRTALGASRLRLFRLLLTESVAIATMAALVGVLVASWAADLTTALLRSAPAVSVTSGVPVADVQVYFDSRLFFIAAGTAAAAVILIGVSPAWRGARTGARAALGRQSTPRTRSGPRVVLLVAQVAASLVLLVCAVLLFGTLRNLTTAGLGLNRDRTVLVWTAPAPAARVGVTPLALWQNAIARAAAVPGVQAASASVEGVLGGTPAIGPQLQAGNDPDHLVRAEATMTVAPGFFTAVGQPLLHGREFTWRDDADAPPVVIVNASLARRLFGTYDPVGAHVRIAGTHLPPMEIVGIVADTRSWSPRRTDGAIYYPVGQNLRRLTHGMCLAIRANAASVPSAADLRSALGKVDRNLPILKIDTVAEQLDSVLYQERLLVRLAVSLGSVAVLLTCLGLYGIMSFLTTRRVTEIGIRLALGARPTQVMAMMLAQGASMALLGVAVGTPLAYAAARGLAGTLFGVGGVEPLILIVASAMLTALVLAGAAVPAWRAAGIDPVLALRAE